MRQLKVIPATLLLGALLAGCGNDDSSTASPTEAATSGASASASRGETVLDGTYAKSVTVTDAKSAGIGDEDFLRSNFGDDGPTTISFKFEGNRWTLFVTPSGGAAEPGDVGSIKYDEHGDAVLTSESEGCPGCTYVYDWQLEGNQLTLTIVGHESSDPPEGLAIVRFVTEGVFASQS